MNCQEFEELSGAYALDSVTPEERRAAEEHLADCPKCRLLLRELQSVVDLFPLSVSPVEPPPALKERIFSSIEAGKIDNPQSISPLVLVPGEPVQQPQIRRQSWGIWRRWSTHIAAIAAVLMLALLSVMTVWNISLQQQITELQTMSTKSYSIKGSPTMPGVQGQLIYFPQQRLSVLVMRGLPRLEGVHVYQGWLLQGKQSTSIGLLNVQDGVATVDFEGEIKGYDAAAVSLEPGPMASKDASRGQVVAMGELG